MAARPSIFNYVHYLESSIVKEWSPDYSFFWSKLLIIGYKESESEVVKFKM